MAVAIERWIAAEPAGKTKDRISPLARKPATTLWAKRGLTGASSGQTELESSIV